MKVLCLPQKIVPFNMCGLVRSNIPDKSTECGLRINKIIKNVSKFVLQYMSASYCVRVGWTTMITSAAQDKQDLQECLLIQSSCFELVVKGKGVSKKWSLSDLSTVEDVG